MKRRKEKTDSGARLTREGTLIYDGHTDWGKERLLNKEAWEHAVLATG